MPQKGRHVAFEVEFDMEFRLLDETSGYGSFGMWPSSSISESPEIVAVGRKGPEKVEVYSPVTSRYMGSDVISTPKVTRQGVKKHTVGVP